MSAKTRLNTGEILRGALEIVRKEGEEKLSARELAKRLNCSTQPILYHFATMTELKLSVLDFAEKIYTEYIARKLTNDSHAIENIAIAHTVFARREANLFKFLFLNTSDIKTAKIPLFANFTGETALSEIIANATGLRPESSARLFTSIWWTAHGIATMLATNSAKYTEAEVAEILMLSYDAVRNKLLSEQYMTSGV